MRCSADFSRGVPPVPSPAESDRAGTAQPAGEGTGGTGKPERACRLAARKPLSFSRPAIGLSLCLCLCAGGCGGLFAQPPVAKAYFAIEPGRIESLNSTQPATRENTVLRVRTLRVAPPYDGAAFVYRIGPSQFDTDYYNNFIAPPASLLTSGLIQWLSASCPMTVCDEYSDLRSDLILEGNITALYIDSTVTPSRAVVAGRFFVTRNKNGDIELLSDKSYEASVAVTSRSAPAFAAAWGGAWRQVLEQLAHDLCTLKLP